MIGQNTVCGVVLAGGMGRRMQHLDKGLMLFNNRPLVSYAINALQPLVGELLISANRNRDQYSRFGHPVIDDASDRFDGPLAGILSALRATDADVLMVVPCDSPMIQTRHLSRLLAAVDEASCIAVAFDGERLHPVVMAFKSYLRDDLQQYLATGQRKLQLWLERHPFIQVDFSAEPEIFVNLNTLADLAELENRPMDKSL